MQSIGHSPNGSACEFFAAPRSHPTQTQERKSPSPHSRAASTCTSSPKPQPPHLTRRTPTTTPTRPSPFNPSKGKQTWARPPQCRSPAPSPPGLGRVRETSGNQTCLLTVGISRRISRNRRIRIALSGDPSRAAPGAVWYMYESSSSMQSDKMCWSQRPSGKKHTWVFGQVSRWLTWDMTR